VSPSLGKGGGVLKKRGEASLRLSVPPFEKGRGKKRKRGLEPPLRLPAILI
jgi:hypothetical protein